MQVVGWKAWYVGGRAYDSDVHIPKEMPTEGMLCVVEKKAETYAPGKHYKEIVDGHDWYVWDGERWSGTETGAWGEWLPQPDGLVVIRSSSRVPNEKIEAIQAEAVKIWR